LQSTDKHSPLFFPLEFRQHKLETDTLLSHNLRSCSAHDFRAYFSTIPFLVLLIVPHVRLIFFFSPFPTSPIVLHTFVSHIFLFVCRSSLAGGKLLCRPTSPSYL